MKHALLAAASALLFTTTAAPAMAQNDYANQVVKLYITYQRDDERRPWAKSPPRQLRALGVVVDGEKILTTAQMVGDATLIQVEKHGNPRKYEARVFHLDPEINLALLAVDVAGFFADLHPVKFATQINTEGQLSSVRWSNGQLESSSSYIARVEVGFGPTSKLEHIFILTKSDFASGGWADPVFSGETFIGLTCSQANDLAWIIPAEVGSRYLRAATAGAPYRGFGALRLDWQVNGHPALAASLGMVGEPWGILILGIPWGATGCGILQARDVLLSLDGHRIESDGLYAHPRYGRIKFTNIAIDGHLAGDSIPAQVLRDGRRLDLALEIKPYPSVAHLIPWWPVAHRPAFLVAGGLVFRELDVNYLMSWGKNWREATDPRLYASWKLDAESQGPMRRRIVILAYIVPSSYTIGYQNLENLAVRSVNGREVDSIAEVEEGFLTPQDGFHTIALHPNTIRDEIVLDATGFAEATAAVLKRYGIPERAHLEKNSLPDLGPDCRTP